MKNIIKSLLRWARTTKAGDDSKDFPVQQVGYLAKVGDSLMWFPYGMHANVPIDELVLMVSMQGNPEARVSIPGSPKKRVKPLAASEVVFFHPDTGSKLHFKANGDILIVSTGLVTIDSAEDATITVGGDAAIDATGKTVLSVGTILQLGGITALKKLVHEEFITLYNSHTHIPSGSVIPTSPPDDHQASVGVHTTTKARGDG